jgi:GTP-binding protein EngB required for normal cell division
MNPTTSFEERAEAVRRQTLTVLQALRQKGRAFELPEPPAALGPLERKLTANEYEVLVVGEAKRGKSTFVNALIGRDLLPTDVDIATSQVFRVCPAQREAYRLRFEDGSQQAITAAGLPCYGSQVLADVEGVPRLDQLIRWIEVDVPVCFLPANVRILDTPGLGALYAAHAEITHRFVPRADAVVFVLDSQAPIGAPEVAFVEALLKVTPSLLFIQTKIDLFRKEAWQEIQKRNQDILAQRFKDRLADPRVWPISSTNLRKAARTGDEDYLVVSRHKELAAALQAFLYRVGAWGRAAEALVMACHYHDIGRATLAGRLENVREESKQKRSENQQRALECRKQFDADWGERGQQRRDLLESLHNAAALAKRDFLQALQPGGAIESNQRATIEALSSLDEAKQYANGMAVQVQEAALEKWQQVSGHFQSRCLELLAPFLNAAEAVSVFLGAQNVGQPIVAGRAIQLSGDTFERFRRAYSDAAITATAGYVSLSVLTSVLTVSFPPAAVAGLIAAAILAGSRGWKSVAARQLKETQQELLRHMSSLIQQIRGHYLDVNSADGRFGLVDEFFTTNERELIEKFNHLASQKLTESRAEITRLVDEGKLNEAQRQAKAEQIRKDLVEWDALSLTVQEIERELQDMEQRAASSVPV